MRRHSFFAIAPNAPRTLTTARRMGAILSLLLLSSVETVLFSVRPHSSLWVAVAVRSAVWGPSLVLIVWVLAGFRGRSRGV